MKRGMQARQQGRVPGKLVKKFVRISPVAGVPGRSGVESLTTFVTGKASSRGYALLDVVLAVTLFAITVTGLLRVMRGVGDTSAGFARDRYVQQQLEGLLAEKRRLAVDAMAYESVDALTGITFRTYVEPYQIDNGEGDELADLYKLTAEATFLDDGGEQVEKAELIIHYEEK
jgi:hypothetical protein